MENVDESRCLPRRLAGGLALLAILLPHTLESEIGGPLDAQHFRLLLGSIVWAVETSGFSTMLGIHSTTQIQLGFPSSAFLVIQSIVVLILLVMMVAQLQTRISGRTALWGIIISIVFSLLILGVFFSDSGGYHSLSVPIPLVQVAFYIVIRYRKRNTQSCIIS